MGRKLNQIMAGMLLVAGASTLYQHDDKIRNFVDSNIRATNTAHETIDDVFSGRSGFVSEDNINNPVTNVNPNIITTNEATSKFSHYPDRVVKQAEAYAKRIADWGSLENYLTKISLEAPLRKAVYAQGDFTSDFETLELSALATGFVETEGDDDKVGAAGEVSRYQFMGPTLKHYGHTQEKAKTLHGATQIVFDIQDQLLQRNNGNLFETNKDYNGGPEAYAVKILGTMLVLSNPEKYGVSVPEPRDYLTHKVLKGDNLFRLGKHYGISEEEIRVANNLRTNLITIGQELVIPTLDFNKE